MSRRTKKIGSAGRFGVRYGRKIRKMVADIEKVQKKRHECPNCNKFAVKRLSAAIWTCRACGIKFSGGAYTPKSAVTPEAGAQAESFMPTKKVIEVAKPTKKRDKFKGKQKPKQEKKEQKEEIKIKKNKGK